MAASPAVDVAGPSPISFTGSLGAQEPVPLPALTFSRSGPNIADDWAPEFNRQDKTAVLVVAAARVAAGRGTGDR